MFFFFSSTNTKERIHRIEAKTAISTIHCELCIAKHSRPSRRAIAELEITNLMNKYDIDYINNFGAKIERIQGKLVFTY